VGAFVGFLAGLLGIGGGMTLVPILAALFSAQALTPDHSVHLALGTGIGLGDIHVFRERARAQSPRRRRLGIVRRLAPGMVGGTLLSDARQWLGRTALARTGICRHRLRRCDSVAARQKPAAARTMPGLAGTIAVGLAIGIVCGLVSAGGAFLTVPFMLLLRRRYAHGDRHCSRGQHPGRVDRHDRLRGQRLACRNAAHVIAGIRVPAGTGGFGDRSVLTAPFGARAAHRLPVAT